MRLFTDPAQDPWLGSMVDTGHWFAMNDKLQHVLAAGLVTDGLARWTDWPWWVIASGVLAAGLLVEIAERIRLALGCTFMADYISYRDMVANLVGVALALLLL